MDLTTHRGSCQCGAVKYVLRTKHYFCKTCGVHPFTRPGLDPTRWAVNVRCLERARR